MPPPSNSIPFDVAVDREQRWLEQVREMIRAEVEEATRPLVKLAEQLERDHDALLMQAELTANNVASMNTALTKLQSWAVARGGREDRLDRKVDRLLEAVDRVFKRPDLTGPPQGPDS